MGRHPNLKPLRVVGRNPKLEAEADYLRKVDQQRKDKKLKAAREMISKLHKSK